MGTVNKPKTLNDLYNSFWVATQEQLVRLREDERALLEQFPTEDRSLAHKLIAGLYSEYVDVVGKLNECYDQMVHPQKVELLEKLLQNANGRLNELKLEVNNIELSEFMWFDDFLMERKMIPQDIQIIAPYYTEDRSQEVLDALDPVLRGAKLKAAEEARIALEEEIKKKDCEAKGIEYIPPGGKPAAEEEDELTSKRKKKKKGEEKVLFIKQDPIYTPEELEQMRIRNLFLEAIQNIQSHERARQDRIRWYDLIANKKRQARMLQEDVQEVSSSERLRCVQIIQGAWRRYKARKDQYKHIETEQFLLGALYPSHYDYSVEEEMRKFVKNRKSIRRKNRAEYIKAIEDEKARILVQKTPILMEDISDHIRAWFKEWYYKTLTFDGYPNAKNLGTILVIRGDSPTPEEWKIQAAKSKDQIKKEKEQAKKEKAKLKELKRKEKEKKKADLEKKKAKGIIEYELKLSKVTPILDEIIDEYNENWFDLDESANKDQRFLMYPVTVDKYAEVHQELRPIVDDMMRLELKILKKAANKTRKKNKWKKVKGPKATKLPKQKKVKVKKDISADRTNESIIQELIDKNILIPNYPRSRLNDFIGDYNLPAYEQRLALLDPYPAMGQARNIVRACIINPLSGDGICCPRSCLIAGPPQCGKMVLVRAAVAETESVVFDLSPESVVNYKPGNDIKMMAHLVTKMAKIVQPSIILVRNAHRAFYKKVPPEEKDTDPQRLSKVLQKLIVKTIVPGDRVMVVGTTSYPTLAKGALTKCFERIILLPQIADYGSIVMWYNHLLFQRHGIDRMFSCSPLALVTRDRKFTFGQIMRAVENVLNVRRLITLSVRPLIEEELLEYLIQYEVPVTPKEEKAYLKWYKKTPWGKKRTKYLKVETARMLKLQKG